ncbi:MAG: GntR family transcriptional regulator [Protaetiibacter sp.]
MSTVAITPVGDRRPLAVQVYDRLFDALISPENAGTEIPTEWELVSLLNVSRTTVRQALALLEEDGHLERGAGRRRIVARKRHEVLPNPPLEEMLATSADVTVEAVGRRIWPSTRWSSELLRIDHETPVIVWESILRVGGRIAASALEMAPPAAVGAVEEATDRTLLATLGGGFRQRAEQVSSRLSAYSATTRNQFDEDVSPSDGAITFTQVLEVGGVPAYVSKNVVRLGVTALTLANRTSPPLH